MSTPQKTADTFTAVTWNVYHGTSVRELTPLLRERLREGVTVFLFQEMANPAHLRMLEDAGLKYFFHPRQYVVAWVPLNRDLSDIGWKGSHGHAVRLSKQSYQSQGGDGWQYTDAAVVTLTDSQGRSLEALSYHTPAHVQRAPSKRNPRRYKALRDSMKTLAKRGRKSPRPVLYGGDDNVDEHKAPRLWAFMLKRATGLAQVQAPHATHGGGRRIDDFRVKGLRARDGWVRNGGGDHKAHVRVFQWVK